MKIMAFVGSPRKGSNIDTLIDKVIEGAKSKIEAEVEKIYLYEANIKNCTGCLACTAFRGGQDCPLKDDMAGILQRMIKADMLIFGSPNHVHSMSAALTNLFCRMQPLIKMQAIKDESGKILSATATTLISGKKAVMVASQGDFSPSASALLLRALDSNLKDFRLKKVAEVFSTGNLEIANVKNKEADLQQAFEAGVKLVIL
jgi:NAD(P)H-dependent FMN reductase